MPKSRKAGVVDSYAAIKAAQHAVQTRPPKPPAAPAPTGEPSDLKALGAYVTRTAVPAKHVIECYKCGYTFQLHGRAPKTNCSKCRATLDLTDHTIDRKWKVALKTAGTIRIATDGVVEAGDLIGNDIIVEGTIEGGTVRAMRRLELRAGARFSEGSLCASNLVIAAGATIAFTAPAKYRDVEILGALRANLHASGTVTIRASGSLEGQLNAPHLIVEDDAGLVATVRIEPTAKRK